MASVVAYRINSTNKPHHTTRTLKEVPIGKFLIDRGRRTPPEKEAKYQVMLQRQRGPDKDMQEEGPRVLQPWYTKN